MEAAAAACAKPASDYTCARREPEKTALYQVLQNHLLTFEQEWTDQSEGRTLPSFVTGELRDFLGCGILARGLAQLFCPTCHARYVVGWSCKGRGFCPSCGGRRMNAGALTLVDHVLPDVRIVLDPEAHPVAKGYLCGQHAGFNLHAATRVAANDEQGRLALCKYILRSPLANAWGAGRLCRPRTIAGRLGNPLRVSMLTTG